MSDMEVLVGNLLFYILQMLMITGGRVVRLAELGSIKETEKDLAKVREDLDRAVDGVRAQQIKKTSEHLFFVIIDSHSRKPVHSIIPTPTPSPPFVWVRAKARHEPPPLSSQMSYTKPTSSPPMFWNKIRDKLERPITPTLPSPTLPSPTLQSVRPNHGPVSGGGGILLTGYGFKEGQDLLVRFGDGTMPVRTVFYTPSLLSCRLPPSDSARTVIVTLYRRDMSEIQSWRNPTFEYTDREG